MLTSNDYNVAFNQLYELANAYLDEHPDIEQREDLRGNKKILKALIGKSKFKKVHLENQEYGDGSVGLYAECPNKECQYEFTDKQIEDRVDYCPECGQALDWSALDEDEY